MSKFLSNFAAQNCDKKIHMAQVNYTIEYYLDGNPKLEVHKSEAGFALFNPAKDDYITQFGDFTHFGPYVCDCVAVRESQNGRWGIITLEGDIVLYPAYDYVDYPFRIEKESYIDLNSGREGGRYKKIYFSYNNLNNLSNINGNTDKYNNGIRLIY